MSSIILHTLALLNKQNQYSFISYSKQPNSNSWQSVVQYSSDAVAPKVPNAIRVVCVCGLVHVNWTDGVMASATNTNPALLLSASLNAPPLSATSGELIYAEQSSQMDNYHLP